MAADIADTHVSYMVALRQHEKFHSIVYPFAGVCSRSGTALMEVRLAWDDSVLGDYDKARKIAGGGWTHQVKRHIDGSWCPTKVWDREAHDYHPTALEPDNCYQQPKCPKCHQYNMCDTAMEAYGNRVTCRNPHCDYTDYFSIGD